MTMEIILRFAAADEAPLLATMNIELAQDVDYRRPLPEPAFYRRRMDELLAEGYRAVIFEESGEVAAYALFIDRGDEIYLQQFYVRRSFRRRGLGREAMRMLIDTWPRDRALVVDTFANNSAALAFWRAVGYRDYQVVLRMEAGERKPRE